MKTNKRKKSIFEQPAAEIIKLENIDVITTSVGDEDGETGEDKDPDQGVWVNYLNNKN